MSGAKADKRTTGKKRRQQKKIFKKRTGITAFLSKEIFFTTSYNPNKAAETKASNEYKLVDYSILQSRICFPPTVHSPEKKKAIYRLPESTHNHFRPAHAIPKPYSSVIYI